jgi:dinuclear metal center YbgI/SA1388 family protein
MVGAGVFAQDRPTTSGWRGSREGHLATVNDIFADVIPPLPLREVVAALEGLYPPRTASSWDRVGLASGDLDQPVSLVHFAVDPTLAVIEEARAAGADLLVTHHPLLLRGVHSVATTGAKGASVTALIENHIALYVAHTNADVASPGVCDALAGACALVDVEPLQVVDGVGHGRVGSLALRLTLREFVNRLSAALPKAVGGIRVAGPPDALVSRVAVVGGAGDDFFDEVRSSGADVYVTADLRHHPALEAREEARGGTPYLVDAGHWATEWLWLESACSELLRALAGRGTSLSTHICTLRTDPWDFVVGAATCERLSDSSGDSMGDSTIDNTGGTS